jgi:benzoate transport
VRASDNNQGIHILMADPRTIIDTSPMRPLQIAAVAVTVGLNALDGFDVLSISFASPGIAKDWGIDRAALGAVLSMELIGMAIGSILLGGLADRIGRRPTILGCLAVMVIGMSGATTAHGVVSLSVWRVLTGLGIGGMLAAINAVAAEFSNARRRGLALAVMVIGYPIGAALGGTFVSMLLKGGEWRVVFEFGAIVTACFIPLVWFLIPESVPYLADRQPVDALAKINRTLARLGHPLASALSARSEAAPKQSIRALFGPGMIPTTLILTFAYFAHIVSFYFILKWIPKIVADIGFNPALAGGVLVWANVGGALGGVVFGLLTQRFSLKALTVGALVIGSAMVAFFGRGASDLTTLATVAAIAGFFTNGAIVGLYSIFAYAFPTHLRATGTGFVIGLGRGGGALAPFVGGVLFQAGYGLQTVAIIMACGSLFAAAALTMLKLNEK